MNMQLFSYLAARESCFSAEALLLDGLQGRDLTRWKRALSFSLGPS